MSTENQPGPEISGDDSLEDAHEADRRVRRLFFACAAVTVVTTVAIFLVLFDNAASYFFGARVSEVIFGGDAFERTITFFEFFTGTRWAPDHSTPAHGVLPIVWGTLAITIGAGLVSIPIGTATALYLSEYARTGTRNRLKPVLEVLAGIPTIVYGYFAVSFLTPVVVGGLATNVINPTGAVLDSISHLAPFVLEPAAEWMMGVRVGRYSLLAGVLVVGTMTIPMVSSISEDAMQAVPDDLRNGAYALGATKYQVSLRIVLPAAVSGIFASYILALSRAIGETMAVTLAVGMTPQISANPLESMQTMTAYMVQIGISDVSVDSIGYQSLFAVGLTLFAMTLAMNLCSLWVKSRYREEYQ